MDNYLQIRAHSVQLAGRVTGDEKRTKCMIPEEEETSKVGMKYLLKEGQTF